MTINRVSLANAAISRCGMNRIGDFADADSKEAESLRENYDFIIANELELHPWRWCMGQYQLTKLTETVGGWGAVYQRPVEALTIRRVLIDEHQADWGRFGGQKVVIKQSTGANNVVALDGVFHLAEAHWPGYFAECAILKLCAMLSTGVARDGEMATAFNTMHERQWSRAKHADSSQDTAQVIDSTLLGGVRRGSHTTY